jgi:hypothetical protein
MVEAMKIENILRAERNCMMNEQGTRPGASLAVDQIFVQFVCVRPTMSATRTSRKLKIDLSSYRWRHLQRLRA